MSKTILIVLSKKTFQKFLKATKTISKKIGRITVILSHGHLLKALNSMKKTIKLNLLTILVKMLTKLKDKNNLKPKKISTKLFHQTKFVSLS